MNICVTSCVASCVFKYSEHNPSCIIVPSIRVSVMGWFTTVGTFTGMMFGLNDSGEGGSAGGGSGTVIVKQVLFDGLHFTFHVMLLCPGSLSGSFLIKSPFTGTTSADTVKNVNTVKIK